LTAPAQRRDETIQNFHDPEKTDFRRRGNPQKRPEAIFRQPVVWITVATQFQSDLELLDMAMAA
jgi:hypothetical protein